MDKRIKYKIIAIENYERNWWSIIVKVMENCYKGMIMLLYHSSNNSDAVFIDCLEEACTSDMLNDNIIVMGDFNIDMKLKKYVQGRIIRIMDAAVKTIG